MNEFSDRSVTDLMCAMVALAYDDYVNGAILLNNSEYETNSGVVKLLRVDGKEFKKYSRHQQTDLNSRARNYATAKMFLEGTRLGDYLLWKAKADIEKGKYRGSRKTIAFDMYEGVNR